MEEKISQKLQGIDQILKQVSKAGFLDLKDEEIKTHKTPDQAKIKVPEFCYTKKPKAVGQTPNQKLFRDQIRPLKSIIKDLTG